MNLETLRPLTATQPASLREIVNQHSRTVTVLAALGAALDARVGGAVRPAALQARVDDMLATLGLSESLEGHSAADLRQLLAEIRFNMLLDAKLLFGESSAGTWSHTERALLQAGGDVSAGFVATLAGAIAPRLDGLSARLDAPGAAFLDIGVGVAGLAIAMARRWPALGVVGIDPWAPSLELARENVERAGLAGQIQLREQAAEQLQDTRAFDLAWLPSAFLPETALGAACVRVFRALRPGGWLLFAMAHPGTEPETAALVRLRTTLWGGSVLQPAAIEALLRHAGFADLRPLPAPPGAVVAMLATRRPLE